MSQIPAAPPSASSSLLSKLMLFFAPPGAIPLVAHTEEEVNDRYRYWRRRLMIATMVGYALYYFVRKNLSFAMPVMGKELGITKAELGMYLTLHGLIYGISRFANGALGDKTNARSFMTTGLILSAIMNVCFGLSSAAVTFGVFWMINGWVQGMGFPPCARLMTHWFPPQVLASRMAVWNTSHSIGAGLIAVLCGFLAKYDWRLCFFVPAGLALLGSVYLWAALRDTPPSVGLPEVPGTVSAATSAQPVDHWAFLKEFVFGNKYIWFLSLANFFVYVVRYGILDWGPTFLHETKGYEIDHAAWTVAAFEISGVMGMLACGLLTDRVFGGRGARACLFYMALAGLSLFLFWRLADAAQWLSVLLLCAGGFFIYGPQALIGIAVANLATKRGAATAAGFTGIFGYASTIVSGWGLGLMVQKGGWTLGFDAIIAASVVGTLLFAACWPARAHGYDTKAS